MTKVVAFGGKGMVGSRVVELLQKDFQFVVPEQTEVDITNQETLNKYLSKEKPQVVINFAAVTDVTACEIERENKNGNVWKVNALAPGVMSHLSKTLNFFFIQISTDMVFSGSKSDKGPYLENHKVSEAKDLNWYGASKAEGERLSIKNNPKSTIIRINNPVGARYSNKKDYAEKIISLYDEGKLFPMFDDQFISITYVDELAEALKAIIDKNLSGIFHVSSNDSCTPFEFASSLLKKTRHADNIVKKSLLEDFIKDKDRRRYPQFGGLNSYQTQSLLGIEFLSWNHIVNKLNSYLQKG